MKLVIVGGQARKVGKTSVISGLIQGLSTFDWTAVKITHHRGDADSPEAQSPDDLPGHLGYLLSEEKKSGGHGDTSRYLAAGARRSLWLRTREGKLSEALPGLLEALAGDEHVIIESNSILAFLKPAVFLLVIGGSGWEVKASAREFLGRADALVSVESDLKTSVGQGQLLPIFGDKPIFPVPAGEWSSPALCHFVCQRLALVEGREAP